MALSIARTRRSQEEEDGEYSDTNLHEDSDDSGPEPKEAILMDEDSDGSDAFIDDDDDDD